MQQKNHQIAFRTLERGLIDITHRVVDWVASTGISSGMLTLFVRHTSASLVIQENADDEVLKDLERFFDRLVPMGDSLFRHTAEGPDDMPAHVRAALTQVSLSIPVCEGCLALGTWQGIFLYEHRVKGKDRKVVCHLIGT
ncbi:MAG: secondary thiamine-phosphate synthase enzyme YjbQ [Nitrospiria bacterium]